MGEAHRILLAEDDPGIASVLAMLLEDEGYRVGHAATAADAAEAARGGGWDLFLVDSFDQNATAGPSQVLRGLLGELAPRAPVLVLTGHTWATRMGASELGVDAVVPKPFDLDRLSATIRAALAH